ncbi:hypothetical protein [Modestobacter sp. URMC 112]
MYRPALVSPLLGTVLATVLLTGCSAETPVQVTAGSGAPVESPAGPSSAGTTAADPSAAPTTPAPTGHPDEDDGGSAGTSPAGTRTAPVTRAPASAAPPTTTPPGAPPATEGPVVGAPGTGTSAEDPSTDGGAGAVVWPAEASPVHGGQVWAVYLAVGSPDSDWDGHMLGEAEGYLVGHGYTGSGIGEVGCDQGAAEQLGFDPADHRLAVYFDSAARAQEFVGVYDRQDLGSARVTTYCLD